MMKMLDVTRSAPTFLVATGVHAELGTVYSPQMGPPAWVGKWTMTCSVLLIYLMQILMSVREGAMTAVRSVSTLLDHTTATVSVAFS